MEIKKIVQVSVLILVIAGGVSYGLSNFFPFLKIFAIATVLQLPIFLLNRDEKDAEFVEKEKLFDQIVQEFENALKERDAVIESNNEAIAEYEALLETQEISIDCDCGKGKFEGFFSKDKENIRECPECKTKYKIIPNYEMRVTSEPLNNEEIFNKISEEKEKYSDEE